MELREIIYRKLEKAFAPTRLTVLDESHKHAGHAGARPRGGTHFCVEIVSEKFKNLSKIAAHRLVYAALAEEIDAGVHALAITAKAEA